MRGMGEKRYLEVIEIATREVVERVDVTGQSEHNIDRCIRGMLINMNRDKFIVADTNWGKEP